MGGHVLVTAIRGEVTRGQVLDSPSVTVTPVQMSWAEAIKVLETEQASNGALKLLLKFAEAPGAREASTNTVVLGTGWLLTTMT